MLPMMENLGTRYMVLRKDQLYDVGVFCEEIGTKCVHAPGAIYARPSHSWPIRKRQFSNNDAAIFWPGARQALSFLRPVKQFHVCLRHAWWGSRATMEYSLK